jgi:hypothetical protein
MLNSGFIGTREDMSQLASPTGARRKKAPTRLKRAKSPRKVAEAPEAEAAQAPIEEIEDEDVELPDPLAFDDDLDEPRPSPGVEEVTLVASPKPARAKSPKRGLTETQREINRRTFLQQYAADERAKREAEKNFSGSRETLIYVRVIRTIGTPAKIRFTSWSD